MEHLKNIAVGFAGTAVIAAGAYSFWWSVDNYPLITIGVIATPFLIFAMWGLGASLRRDA